MVDNENMDMKAPHAVIKWILVAGIAIVLNLFLAFAIKVAYDEPKYDDYCSIGPVAVVPETKDECVASGGRWTEERFPRNPSVPAKAERTGYCDPDYTCREEFQDARALYERNVFVALTVAGVALIIGSVFLSGLSALSLGLSSGGVLSLIIGTMRYWSDMDDILRLIVLGIALAALIWV